MMLIALSLNVRAQATCSSLFKPALSFFILLYHSAKKVKNTIDIPAKLYYIT